MKGNFKRILKFSSLGLLTAIASHVYAAGYRLEFESPSVLCDGGDAAVVEDASTNWYNSAGLVDLPQQFVASSTYAYGPTKFNGTVTAPSIVAPFVPGANFRASGRATTYNNVVLPATHYNYPFACNRYAFGLTVVPAWGLLEDYGHTAITRYNLDRIYTRSIDIAPSFAMKITDRISVGIGPDIHYWYLSSKAYVRTQPLTPGDSVSRLSTDDWAWGGHVGVLVHLNEKTRIGLNYRSKITMQMSGYSDFAFDHGPGFESNTFNFTVPLPPTTALSFYRDINPCWAVMGSIVFDQWSVVRNLHGKNFITPTGTLTSVNIPQAFHNTFDFKLGTHYKINDQIFLRGAVVYVQTPTIAAHRDINFPDGEKLGLNIGGRFQVSKCVAIDMMYAHVFVRGGTVNITNVFGAHTNGSVHSSIDIAGTQLVWSI